MEKADKQDRHDGPIEKLKDAVEDLEHDIHESRDEREADLYRARPGAGETNFTSTSWSEDEGDDPTDVEVVNEDYP